MPVANGRLRHLSDQGLRIAKQQALQQAGPMFSCLAALDTKVYRPFCILQAGLQAGSGEIHRGCRATREASPQALYATPPSGEAACSLKRLAACRRPPQAACTLQAASAGGLLANSSFRRGCSQPRRLAACRRFRRASPALRRFREAWQREAAAGVNIRKLSY